VFLRPNRDLRLVHPCRCKGLEWFPFSILRSSFSAYSPLPRCRGLLMVRFSAFRYFPGSLPLFFQVIYSNASVFRPTFFYDFMLSFSLRRQASRRGSLSTSPPPYPDVLLSPAPKETSALDGDNSLQSVGSPPFLLFLHTRKGFGKDDSVDGQLEISPSGSCIRYRLSVHIFF